MNSFTESTWIAPVMEEEKKIMKSYIDYPPRKLQSYGYTGPVTISNYQKFQWIRETREGRRTHRAAHRHLMHIKQRLRSFHPWSLT